MKVLHIVGDSKFGGASVPILRLAQLSQSMGWQTEVLTTESTFAGILSQKNIKIVAIDVIWREIRPLKDLKGLYRLYRFLQASDYTIVHTHTSKAGFIGRLAAKLAKIPIIFHTVQGFAFHEASSPLALTAYATLERLAARWCDRLILVTEFHRQWALHLGIGNPQKNVVISNWIYPERIEVNQPFSVKKFRQSLGVQSDEFILLVAGRLATQKGHKYLIRAIPLLLKNRAKPFKIIMAGEGDLIIQLQQLVKHLKVEKQVLLWGFCENISHLLAAADLIVLPSLWEGLSISLLEAMAVGKPIITTTIGSNLEVLENEKNALLVPVKDPDALAEAIIKLMNHPDLSQRIGKNAQLTFKNNYTEEILLNVYQKLYLHVLQEKGIEP